MSVKEMEKKVIEASHNRKLRKLLKALEKSLDKAVKKAGELIDDVNSHPQVQLQACKVIISEYKDVYSRLEDNAKKEEDGDDDTPPVDTPSIVDFNTIRS